MFSILLFNFFLNAMDVDKIMKAADEKRGLQTSYSVEVLVESYKGQELNDSSLFFVKIKDFDTSLVEQLKPERSVGRKILMKGLDMWLFTPDIKKPVRISLQQKLVGEVANGDIARTNFRNDYNAKFLKEELINQTNTYRFALSSKSDKTTYSKIDYWLNKTDFSPIRAVFYAASGKPLKTAEYFDLKPIQNLKRITKVVVRDLLNKNNYSILTYSKFKLEKFDNSVFSKEQMD